MVKRVSRIGYAAAVVVLGTAIVTATMVSFHGGQVGAEPFPTPTPGPVKTPFPEAPGGPPLPLPNAATVLGSPVAIAPVIYAPVGRYVISEVRALALGRALAQAPINREAVRPIRYRDFVDWNNGGRVFTIDLDREMYMVVLSTTFPAGQSGLLPEEPCGWVAMLIDAEQGFLYATSCGRGDWPDRLPAQFGP